MAVAVTAHVVSVDSKAKINIGVNGIYVVSVESFRKDFHDVGKWAKIKSSRIEAVL